MEELQRVLEDAASLEESDFSGRKKYKDCSDVVRWSVALDDNSLTINEYDGNGQIQSQFHKARKRV